MNYVWLGYYSSWTSFVFHDRCPDYQNSPYWLYAQDIWIPGQSAMKTHLYSKTRKFVRNHHFKPLGIDYYTNCFIIHCTTCLSPKHTYSIGQLDIVRHDLNKQYYQWNITSTLWYHWYLKHTQSHILDNARMPTRSKTQIELKLGQLLLATGDIAGVSISTPISPIQICLAAYIYIGPTSILQSPKNYDLSLCRL